MLATQFGPWRVMLISYSLNGFQRFEVSSESGRSDDGYIEDENPMTSISPDQCEHFKYNRT